MKESDLKGNTMYKSRRGGMKEKINQLSKCTNNNNNNKKMRRKKKKKRRGNGGNIINGNDDLLCEILSRIPAKSLMRLKCVSKRWQSLIQYNPYFIDLHSTRSRARPSLFLGCLMNYESDLQGQYLLSADLFEDRAEVHTKFDLADYWYHMQGPINGLVCLFHEQRMAVRIYNPSTRQMTPWIKRRMKKKKLVPVEEEHGRGVEEVHHEKSTYHFGFDPATKEYKLICLSRMRKIKKTTLPDEGGGGGGKLISNVVLIDVLTVSHKNNNNSWRRIDEVPPYDFTGVSVYANGSIYWRKVKRNRLDSTREEPEVMVALDIGSEKFRVIRVPDFILAQPPNRDDSSWGGWYDLLEVDGCVALLHRMNSYTVKLWIFDDDHTKDEEKKITNTREKENWTEEIITLPFCWERVWVLHFQAVPGTDQIIILTEDFGDFLSLHSYDRKMKTFKNVEIRGIPVQTLRSCYISRPFVENLLPLPKQQQSPPYHKHEEARLWVI